MNSGKALRLAYEQAARSPDPSTQMGAIVFQGNAVVGEGFNTFAPGVKHSPDRWQSPLKYEYVCHAEVSAILDAFPFLQLEGLTIAVTLPACTNCAKYMILSGIRNVIGHKQYEEFMAEHSPGWTDSRHLGIDMLEEAGVRIYWFSGAVHEAPTIRIGGQTFDPAIAP